MKNDLHFLSDYVGQAMLDRLQWMTLKPKKILMWGQQGKILAALKAYYPDAELYVMEDESVTLPDHSVDLIFSNLALPWVTDLAKTFAIWQRLLRPHGLCFFSSLGPDTLKECPNERVIIQRIDMHHLGDALIHARFMDPVLDVEELETAYQDVNKMLAELADLNLLNGRLLCEQAERYPITYEIIYGHAWAKANNTPDVDGVVKIPLSHLRRR